MPVRERTSAAEQRACVIPALNAARTIGDVAGALRAALPGARLIAIDDGSVDDTSSVARACCDDVVRFDVNRGKGVALRTGLAHALETGATQLLTIDADGQHEPRFAPALFAALEDADLAIGVRVRGGRMPIGRRITNGLSSRAVSTIVRMPLCDAQSGYRAMRRELIEHVDASGDRFEYETEFLIRAAHAGARIASVPISTVYGAPSNFRRVRDTMRVVRTIWRHRTGVV